MQIFFISPNGLAPVVQALKSIPGKDVRGWTNSGSAQAIGVVEVSGDTEAVALALENAGILLMPDHRMGGPPSQAVVNALSSYGVLPSDTTASAMMKVHSHSGFPYHKPKRYC